MQSEGKYESKFCERTISSHASRDFILAQLKRVVSLVKLFVTAANVSYPILRFVKQGERVFLSERNCGILSVYMNKIDF